MRFFKYAKWLLIPVLLWICLVVLFLTLPTAGSADNETVLAARLQSGEVVTRIYRTQDFFRLSDRFLALGRRSHFILRYQYHASNATLQIQRKIVPIYPLLNSSEPGGRAGLFQPNADLGDTDGLSPPWFPVGDAVLLFTLMHSGSDRVALDVVRVPTGVPAEVRLDVVAGLMELPDPENVLTAAPIGTPPLATLYFSLGTTADFPTLLRVNLPRAPLSHSPTRLYPVRKALLIVLVPTGLVFMFLARLVWQLLKLAIIGLVLAALMWVVRALYPSRMDREVAVAAETEEGRRQRIIELQKALTELLGSANTPPAGRPAPPLAVQERQDYHGTGSERDAQEKPGGVNGTVTHFN